MKLVFEKPELGNYNFHALNIIGPDYDDFTSKQRAYLKLGSEVLFFDNCFGIQMGASLNLLDENNEVILFTPKDIRPCVMFEFKSSVWRDLVNDQREKTGYLMSTDVIQEDLKHYFFQVNDTEFWHILSDEVSILANNTEIMLRKEFNVMSNNIFNE